MTPPLPGSLRMFITSHRGHLFKYSLESFHLNYSQSPCNGFQRLNDLLSPTPWPHLETLPLGTMFLKHYTDLLTMPPTWDIFLSHTFAVASLLASNQFLSIPKACFLNYLRNLLMLAFQRHFQPARLQWAPRSIHSAPLTILLYQLCLQVPSYYTFNYSVSYCLSSPTKMEVSLGQAICCCFVHCCISQSLEHNLAYKTIQVLSNGGSYL